MSLGKAQGLFRLTNSDTNVGSFLTRGDIKTFLCVEDEDLKALAFKNINNVEAIDERKVQKAWYAGEINNAPPPRGSSLDELILLSLIRDSLSGCHIERQVRVKRFKMDLKLVYGGKSVFVEFDGPSHFAVSRYGPPKHEPFRKKKLVEDETGIEVVNWAFWIQRCSSNVMALFNRNTQGYGALWSTNVHFGDFYFDNSADIIDNINSRFNADREGYGYFYDADTCGRHNPGHPIVDKILRGSESIKRLLPSGFKEKHRWLPKRLSLPNP